MINIAEKDRDFLQFLWVTNTKDEDPDIIFYRFKCVGLCSSPFLLNGTLQHHLSEYFTENPELLLILLKSFYVDDFLSGKDSKSETWKLCIEVRECLAKAGFNLHKWACSNAEIMNELNKLEGKSSEPVVSEREVTQDDSTLAKLSVGESAEGVNSSQDQKVLGINWNVERDEMYFDFEKLVKVTRSLNPTKCNLLKMIACLYDPLGIISAVIITMKFLFQEVCALKKLDWDTPLPANFVQKWEKWVNELENTNQIVFARCYFAGFKMNQSVRSLGLYGFSDSIKKAYCAVVYLVSERYDCFVPKLLTSKTKVAPLKPLSIIPRLELQAAVILARLMTSVKE